MGVERRVYTWTASKGRRKNLVHAEVLKRKEGRSSSVDKASFRCGTKRNFVKHLDVRGNRRNVLTEKGCKQRGCISWGLRGSGKQTRGRERGVGGKTLPLEFLRVQVRGDVF